MSGWHSDDPGVMRLPSGRLVRGRGLRGSNFDCTILPEFGVYLLGSRPESVPWDSRWLPWPDFWLPSDQRDAAEVLREAWRRAMAERVEIACNGGRGRTGTALACMAILDGVPAREAVSYVRRHYDSRAVETPLQRLFVRRFPASAM